MNSHTHIHLCIEHITLRHDCVQGNIFVFYVYHLEYCMILVVCFHYIFFISYFDFHGCLPQLLRMKLFMSICLNQTPLLIRIEPTITRECVVIVANTDIMMHGIAHSRRQSNNLFVRVICFSATCLYVSVAFETVMFPKCFLPFILNKVDSNIWNALSWFSLIHIPYSSTISVNYILTTTQTLQNNPTHQLKVSLSRLAETYPKQK